RAEVLQHRTSQPAGTDDEDACCREPRLALRADFRQHHLSGVAIGHVGALWRTQASRRLSGAGFLTMSVTTAAESAPAARTPGSRSSVMPPMATSGVAPMRPFHSPMRPSPCGANAIALRRVG